MCGLADEITFSCVSTRFKMIRVRATFGDQTAVHFLRIQARSNSERSSCHRAVNATDLQ